MATIKDVARDAGVAVGTVSKVLNNIHVSEANRIKVLQSIEKLGYQVDTYARGLKAQYTNTAALIIPNLYNPFFALLANSIENELYERGYRMFLCNSNGDIEKEAEYFSMARQSRVDGIIGLTYSRADEYVSDGFPMVSIDRYYENNIPCVSSDNYDGGKKAAEVFAATGCRNVAYIRTGSRIKGDTLGRGQGFIEACEALGLNCESEDLGEQIEEEVKKKFRRFLNRHKKNGTLQLDAIFFSSDDLAMYVMEEIRSMKIRVPEELEIIGFDGLTIFNRGQAFVSSIRQPIEEIARVSVDLLLKVIHGEQTENRVLLPVEFLKGGTTRSIEEHGENRETA